MNDPDSNQWGMGNNLEETDEVSPSQLPKSIRILKTCVKLKLRFLYLMAILMAIYTGGSFLYIQKINASEGYAYPYFFLLFFIFFIAFIYLLIFLDKRSLFYLEKKVRRSKVLILTSATLTIPVAILPFIAGGLGGALKNVLLKQVLFIFYFPPVLTLVFILVGGVSILILTSIVIALLPSFRQYLDNPLSHKDKKELGASGYWMSRPAEYIGYFLIAIFFVVSVVDASSIYCFGVVQSQGGCYVKKATVAKDISICERYLQDPGYCYRGVISGSNNDFSFCADATDDGVSVRCFTNFRPKMSKEYAETFRTKYIEKDESICKTMKSTEGKDRCYEFFALENKELDLCYPISDSKAKDECLSRFIPSYCESKDIHPKEPGEQSRFGCYYSVAVFLGDSSVCGKILELGKQYECYTTIASQNRDISLCDKIEVPITKDYCLQRAQ